MHYPSGCVTRLAHERATRKRLKEIAGMPDDTQQWKKAKSTKRSTKAGQRHARFPRRREKLEFDPVFARRCSAGDDLLVVYGLENGLTWPRLGLSVSRKIGRAVIRNRWKRRLREAFRLSRERLPAGIDLVVIARPAEEPEFGRLRESLIELATRIANKLERQRGASGA